MDIQPEALPLLLRVVFRLWLLLAVRGRKPLVTRVGERVPRVRVEARVAFLVLRVLLVSARVVLRLVLRPPLPSLPFRLVVVLPVLPVVADFAKVIKKGVKPLPTELLLQVAGKLFYKGVTCFVYAYILII